MNRITRCLRLLTLGAVGAGVALTPALTHASGKTFRSMSCPYSITVPSNMKITRSGKVDEFSTSTYTFAIQCFKNTHNLKLNAWVSATAKQLKKKYTVSLSTVKNGIGRIDYNNGVAYAISGYFVEKGYLYQAIMGANTKHTLLKYQQTFFNMLDTLKFR